MVEERKPPSVPIVERTERMVRSVNPLPVSDAADTLGPTPTGVSTFSGEEKTGLGKGDEGGAGEPPRVGVGVDCGEGNSIGVGVGVGGSKRAIGET
jgi:hypothetical protein